jgi:Protein of unknown function (DUF3147)
MKIQVSFAALKQARWHELVLRFFLGGVVTASAGAIAMRFGPIIGGLFLAFPALLPASLTLVEKHEVQKKAEKGLSGIQRGRQAAAADAAGATLGSVGMIMFSFVVWQLASYGPWIVLPLAILAWAVIALSLWLMRKNWTAFRNLSRKTF